MIDKDGTVLLADFGVAATMERGGTWGNQQMSRNTFVGTPCWMAPEVMEQTEGYAPQSLLSQALLTPAALHAVYCTEQQHALHVSLAALCVHQLISQQCALTVYTAASLEFVQADNKALSAWVSWMGSMTLLTLVIISHLTGQPDLTVCHKHNKDFVIV